MVDRIEGLLGKIPGYDAYHKKESMRDDDHRLRERIANRLDQAVADLTSISGTLASRRQLGAIGAVEGLVRDTRLLSDRVRTASYGYGSLFSDKTVDEFALGQLKAFDVAFDAQVDALIDKIATVGTEGEALETQIRDVSTVVDNLGRLFGARNDVITTASPTQDPNVLSLLEPPVTLDTSTEQLLRVRSGGTVAILGDNYQVGAHIAVRDRARAISLLLLRLDAGPDWLAIADKEEVTCWQVHESEALDSHIKGSAGSATVSGPQGTQDDVPATYDVQESGSAGSATVTILLALAGKGREYSGTQVPLMDIEVYSTGATA